MVVHPGHAEHHDALGLHQPLQQAVLSIAGVLRDERPQAFHHFGDSLQEFRLAGIAERHVGKEALGGRVFHGLKGFQQ